MIMKCVRVVLFSLFALGGMDCGSSLPTNTADAMVCTDDGGVHQPGERWTRGVGDCYQCWCETGGITVCNIFDPCPDPDASRSD
jgi:hypothetical protein